MTHRNRSTRVIGLALLCCFTGLFLWTCSGTGKTIGFFTFWRSQPPVSRPTDKEIGGFASLVRLPQGNADAHYNLARYLVESRRYKEAIIEFKKVATIRPESATAYNGLGVCYDNLRDFQRAMEAYQTALKLDPNLDYVHNNIGCCLMLQGKYDEAIDAFKKAIVLNDQRPRYHNNLGRTYALAGKYDLAIDEFELGGTKPLTQKAAAGQNEQGPGPRAADNNQKQEVASSSQSTGYALPANGRVELLNGNGVNGMARKMRAYLQERGFKVVRCANADSFDYPQTNIYYCREGLEAAQRLLAQIPDINNVKEVKRLDRADTTVKMLMGKDLKPFKKQLEGEP